MAPTKLDNLIVAGRRLRGAPYRWCTHGAFHTKHPAPSDNWVKANGVCCSDLFNVLRMRVGLRAIGGTPHYGNFLASNKPYFEKFNPSRWYTVGTVLLEHYRGAQAEGHIVLVSRPNQLVLQSDSYYGVNERKVAEVQNTYTPFDVAGTFSDMPGAEGLPWRSPWGSISVGGYPGHCASPKETAKWMARVAAVIYGLPPALPIMTSCVELTAAWTGPGCVTDVPGYRSARDHDSLGWFQQRPSQGWGTRAQILNAEYALSRFLDAALEHAPDWPARKDYTPQELGEWAANVQRPRKDLRGLYASKGYPMAKKLLAGTAWETNQWKPPPDEGPRELFEREVEAALASSGTAAAKETAIMAAFDRYARV